MNYRRDDEHMIGRRIDGRDVGKMIIPHAPTLLSRWCSGQAPPHIIGRSSIGEGFGDEDRVVPGRARREERDGRLDQLLQPLDILDRLGGQVGEAPGTGGALGPAGDLLVDRLTAPCAAMPAGRWCRVWPFRL